MAGEGGPLGTGRQGVHPARVVPWRRSPPAAAAAGRAGQTTVGVERHGEVHGLFSTAPSRDGGKPATMGNRRGRGWKEALRGTDEPVHLVEPTLEVARCREPWMRLHRKSGAEKARGEAELRAAKLYWHGRGNAKGATDRGGHSGHTRPRQGRKRKGRRCSRLSRVDPWRSEVVRKAGRQQARDTTTVGQRSRPQFQHGTTGSRA